MKRLIAVFVLSFVSIGGLLAVPASSSAATGITGTTHVNGFVTSNGNPVKNATVSVTCNGTTKTDTTTPSGYYIVFFRTAECPDGSTVSVTARSGNLVGGGTTTTVNREAARNISLGTTNAALPEMSTVTGIAAVVGAGGAFFLIRRRQLEKG